MTGHSKRSLGAILSLAFVLAACGSAATTPPTGSGGASAGATPTAVPGPPTPVTMLTDFLLYGWHAPLFAGKAEGFYSYDGVDVTLEAGKGSADGATKVSTGAAQFAQLDAVSALTAISKGEGLKLIGIYFAKYPGGMCYVSGRHQINSYKDLEGLKIGAAAGDAYMVALPGLMRNAGADPTKYQLITMTAANTTPALISGQIDATPCGLPTFPDRQIAAGKQGLTLKHFLFADHGFGADGFALVTTGKLISSDPSLVQHVVDAWATSAAWSFANPSKAVADFISANPSLNPDSATQSFSGVLPYLKGPNGYFVFNQPSLQATVDFVNQAYSASLQTSAVFDDEFVNKLPAAFKLGKLP